MPRPYPYYPAWDGKAASPLILKAADLLTRRYKGTKNIGTYVNRDMRGQPGQKSVHATGYALDLQYKDEAQARQIWDYLLAHSKELGVCELHWYAYGEYGAGYRCSRGEGKTGVKIFTATDNAGSYQGNPNWLHLELDQNMTPAIWEEVFRATKPV